MLALLDIVVMILMATPALIGVWLTYISLTDNNTIKVCDLRGRIHRLPRNQRIGLYVIFIELPVLIALIVWLEIIFINLPRI